MSGELSILWSDRTTESRMTGTWRSAIPDYKNIPAPCFGACPVDGQIAKWIRQVQQNDYYGAWLTLIENNPFPAIAGRICHHPCETACNRGQLDEAVNICGLERFVGDEALRQGWAFPEPETVSGLSVAVVGGGPAGLSAAYQLARGGHRVVLYEAAAQLGGLLRYGIPSYRLERSILNGEIGRVLDLGITVHLNTDIANGDALEELQNQHDAVFLATGAAISKSLPGLDPEKPWVQDSAEFLAATNDGKSCDLGDMLVVIGGGSAAMDVARTARRLGRQVTVVTLESEGELPAQRKEVTEGKQEGIEFVCSSMMQTVSAQEDGLLLNCIKVDFVSGKTRGTFTVEPVEDSEFTLKADGIIPSIGQDADLARWNGMLEGAGQVLRTDEKCRTTRPGVFAGGDVASMDRFVTQAIGMGKHAAKTIDRYIGGLKAPVEPAPDPETDFKVINVAYHSRDLRNAAAETVSEERLTNFLEVQQCLGIDQAMNEADRCFSCGTCIFCDNCYLYCPDMAINKLDGGYEVNTDYCKGCGLCVAECPTGSITMHQDQF